MVVYIATHEYDIFKGTHYMIVGKLLHVLVGLLKFIGHHM